LQGEAGGLDPAMAGDVCTQPPYVGRGGWSWYTGAAAWMHRAAIESIFGLRMDAASLSFAPCLPAHWPRAELSLQRGGRRLRFILLRATESEARLAGAPLAATLLRVGEPLSWRTAAADACFVIPLGEAPA
jgi:cyclic beta-1,2-glucan synthetase